MFCGMGGLTDERQIAMLGSVITAIGRDDEFAEAFRARLHRPQGRHDRRDLCDAGPRARRDRRRVDLELVAPALPGIVLHRQFLLGQAPDPDVHRARHRPDHPARRRRRAAHPPRPRTTKDDLMTDLSKPEAATDGAPDGPARTLNLGWALVLISVAQLMVVLDGTITNIALPYIGADLDIAGANLTWIVTGYALAFGGLLLLGGRLGDLYGRRRLFMIGLVVFAVASAHRRPRPERGACCSARVPCRASAPRSPRPAALALITTTFPAGPQRNRAFAVYAAMSGAGAAVGLILGGWLTGLDGSPASTTPAGA